MKSEHIQESYKKVKVRLVQRPEITTQTEEEQESPHPLKLIAIKHFENAQHQEFLAYLQRSWSNYTDSHSLCYHLKGVTYTYLSLFEEAQQSLESSLELREQEGEIWPIVSTLSELSGVKVEQAKLAAIKNDTKAVSCFLEQAKYYLETAKLRNKKSILVYYNYLCLLSWQANLIEENRHELLEQMETLCNDLNQHCENLRALGADNFVFGAL